VAKGKLHASANKSGKHASNAVILYGLRILKILPELLIN
jgi:hypothetical protein